MLSLRNNRHSGYQYNLVYQSLQMVGDKGRVGLVEVKFFTFPCHFLRISTGLVLNLV